MDIRPPTLNSVASSRGSIDKKKKISGGVGFNASVDEQDSKSIAATQNTHIFAVDPLFVDLEKPSSRDQAIESGFTLLDELEHLQRQLLIGHVAPETFHAIKNYIDKLPKDDLDPYLLGLVLDIETRAIVELTKIKMGRR